jgi:hypothetical protein
MAKIATDNFNGRVKKINLSTLSNGRNLSTFGRGSLLAVNH